MASPVKTVGTSLLAIQTVATNAVAIGSVIDVSTKFAGCAYVHFGRTATTALTAAMQFRIDASAKASLDGQWYPLYAWQSGVAVAVAPSATAGAAGAKSITVTNTGLFAGLPIFCYISGTIANSEFARVVTQVSTTSITVEDNLVNAQTTSVITTQAEMYAIPLDFSGVGRIRLVASAVGVGAGASTGTGATTVVEGFLTTFDAIT